MWWQAWHKFAKVSEKDEPERGGRSSGLHVVLFQWDVVKIFSFICYFAYDVLMFMECLCLCVSASMCEPRLLWRLCRQVGDQRRDGADVRYDPKHNGENGEPQGLAGRCVGALKIPLSWCLVGLESRRQWDKD